MSKKSIKKVKDKPTFKINVWINTTVIQGSSSWNNAIANKCLQEIDKPRPWKGKFSMYKTFLIIKSKAKTYIKIHDLKNVIGILPSSFNNKVVLIGILEDDMNYISIRCENLNDKDRIIKEFNEMKLESGLADPVFTPTSEEPRDDYLNREISNTPEFTNNVYLNNELSHTHENDNEQYLNHELSNSMPHEENNYLNHELAIPTTTILVPFSRVKPLKEKKMNNKRQIVHNYPTSVIPKSYKNDQKSVDSMGSDTKDFDKKDLNYSTLVVDSDSNASSDEETMWVENTKYIDYVPALGRNVETDSGSIYMYCAYQITPSKNGYASDHSDAD